MRLARALCATTLALLGSAFLAFGQNSGLATGRLVTLQVDSHDLHRKNNVYVYLPPGYDQSKERLPVIYFLHGNPGKAIDWYAKGQANQTVDRFIKAGQIHPLIMVSADGFGLKGFKDRTEFLNAADGSISVEDYYAHELPAYIDSHFRTIRSADARALVGNSSGAYGAINIGGKHTDVFHILVSHSGFFDPKDEDEFVVHMLGPQGARWDANNPLKQVASWRDKKDLHVYMDVGQDDDSLPENQALANSLSKHGIDHVFLTVKGQHEWPLWRRQFPKSILYVDKWFHE